MKFRTRYPRTTENRKLVLELLRRKTLIEKEVALASGVSSGLAHNRDPLIAEYRDIIRQLQRLL